MICDHREAQRRKGKEGDVTGRKKRGWKKACGEWTRMKKREGRK